MSLRTIGARARAAPTRAPRLPEVDGGIVLALFAVSRCSSSRSSGRLAPHEAIYFVVEHDRDPRPYDPGIVFPFGSDVLGRDLFSLVLAGARATLTIVLLAGLARVGAGVLIAAIGSWWRPTRLLTETVAELVSAIPATIVALVLVKVFVQAETSGSCSSERSCSSAGRVRIA